MTLTRKIKQCKLEITAVNKIKQKSFTRFFPSFVKLGEEPDPDPDLDRHQNEKSDPNRIQELKKTGFCPISKSKKTCFIRQYQR